MRWTRTILRTLIAAASICLLTSAAHAGDQGDPAQSCDGNTYEMVECLNAKTAQWDKRMTVAYQQALKDAVPQQHDQLRAAQRLWIQYRDANCLYYGEHFPAKWNPVSRKKMLLNNVGAYSNRKTGCHFSGIRAARAPSPGSMPANACAA
jgi:uncharacterized protein YecT (DUF1311 family)